jgi:hypothetical protein
MSEFVHTLASEYPADRVWRGINTPLYTEISELILPPGVTVEYENLSSDNQIQTGTTIAYQLAPHVARDSTFSTLIPDEVVLRVVDHDAGSKMRQDHLIDNPANTGLIRREVRPGEFEGSSMVHESGEFTHIVSSPFGGFSKQEFEKAVIHHCVKEFTRRTLDHLPALTW